MGVPCVERRGAVNSSPCFNVRGRRKFLIAVRYRRPCQPPTHGRHIEFPHIGKFRRILDNLDFGAEAKAISNEVEFVPHAKLSGGIPLILSQFYVSKRGGAGALDLNRHDIVINVDILNITSVRLKSE